MPAKKQLGSVPALGEAMSETDDRPKIEALEAQVHREVNTLRAAREILVPDASVGMRHEIFTIGANSAVLQWPAAMTSEEYKDFKEWLNLIARKAARSVRSDTKGKSKP